MAGRSTKRGAVRCTFCGGRPGSDALLEVDLRGLRYDYCDAACATAHQQAVALDALLCPDCDEHALGDTGCCAEHLDPPGEAAAAERWLRAG